MLFLIALGTALYKQSHHENKLEEKEKLVHRTSAKQLDELFKEHTGHPMAEFGGKGNKSALPPDSVIDSFIQRLEETGHTHDAAAARSCYDAQLALRDAKDLKRNPSERAKICEERLTNLRDTHDEWKKAPHVFLSNEAKREMSSHLWDHVSDHHDVLDKSLGSSNLTRKQKHEVEIDLEACSDGLNHTCQKLKKSLSSSGTSDEYNRHRVDFEETLSRSNRAVFSKLLDSPGNEKLKESYLARSKEKDGTERIASTEELKALIQGLKNKPEQALMRKLLLAEDRAASQKWEKASHIVAAASVHYEKIEARSENKIPRAAQFAKDIFSKSPYHSYNRNAHRQPVGATV